MLQFEVRNVGSNCSASTLTMKDGIEQAIQTHCLEIKNDVCCKYFWGWLI